MALITCEDCGGPVSTTAAACPKCGRPVPGGPALLTPVAGPTLQPIYPPPAVPMASTARGAAGVLRAFAGLVGSIAGAAVALVACWRWKWPPNLVGTSYSVPIDQFARALADKAFWQGYTLSGTSRDPRSMLIVAVLGGGLVGLFVGSLLVPRRRTASRLLIVPGPGGVAVPVMGAVPTSGLAVASLVFGLLSVVFFCAVPVSLISVILALVFGTAASSSIRRGTASGGGIATTGILLACLALLLDVLIVTMVGGGALFGLFGLANSGSHH